MMKEISIDVSTGEKSERELTEDEMLKIEQTAAIEKKVDEAAISKLNARLALFDKLGLTADEGKLLLS